MSPQMKAILLSFKNLPFERNSSKDVHNVRFVKCILKMLKYWTAWTEKKSLWTFPVPLLHGVRRFPFHGYLITVKVVRLKKIGSTVAREKGKTTGGATSLNQSKGAVFHQRRSWVVSKHILAKSNTVDSLRLQKFDDTDVCGVAGAQKSLTLQTPTKGNLALEKKMTPESLSVISNKPLSPIFNHKPHSLYGANTGRVGIKPCSAVIYRGRDAINTDNMWERNMSEKRKLLINKWFVPRDY